MVTYNATLYSQNWLRGFDTTTFSWQKRNNMLSAAQLLIVMN